MATKSSVPLSSAARLASAPPATGPTGTTISRSPAAFPVNDFQDTSISVCAKTDLSAPSSLKCSFQGPQTVFFGRFSPQPFVDDFNSLLSPLTSSFALLRALMKLILVIWRTQSLHSCTTTVRRTICLSSQISNLFSWLICTDFQTRPWWRCRQRWSEKENQRSTSYCTLRTSQCPKLRIPQTDGLFWPWLNNWPFYIMQGVDIAQYLGQVEHQLYDIDRQSVLECAYLWYFGLICRSIVKRSECF